jgi:GNAT superfamily N-acetyltransferase
MEIEKFSFGGPYRPNILAKILRRDRAVKGLVTWEDFGVVGFVIFRTVRKAIHILNIGVHPDFRRRKIGTALLNAVKMAMRPERKTSIKIEVEDVLLPVHLFLKKNHFQATPVKRTPMYLFEFSLPTRTKYHPVNRISNWRFDNAMKRRREDAT